MSISSKIFTWSSPSKHSLQNLSIPPPLTYTPVPWLASAPPQQDSHAQADSLPAATAATRPLETALGTCGPTVHIQLWPVVNVSDKGRKVLFTANCKRLYMTGIRDVVSNSLSLWISMHLWEGEKISIPWNTLDCPSLLQSKWIVNLSTSLAQVQRAITLRMLFSLSCSYVSWWAVMGSAFVPERRNDRRQFLVLLLMSCFSQLCSLPPMVFFDKQRLFIGTEAKFSMNGDWALNKNV